MTIPPAHSEEQMAHQFGPGERTSLLAAAREALARHLGSEPDPAARPHAGSSETVSAFVTLRHAGELRGCIGLLDLPVDLEEVVRQCAVSAAHDPRFEALKLEELAATSIEISVLGPAEPIRGPSEVEIGRHGLLVSRGARRGLLLPQVAVEQGWGALAFLEHTCLKAGLPPDAWRQGADVRAFTAEVFSDDQPDPEAAT